MLLICLGLCVGVVWSSTYVSRYDVTGYIQRRNRLLDNSTVWFTIDPTFSLQTVKYIKGRMDYMEQHTCMKWVPKPEAEDEDEYYVNLVYFKRVDEPYDCRTYWSHYPITVELAPHCFQHKWVMHEMGHVLGLYHEQQRPDRDCYVEVYHSKLNDDDYQKIDEADVSFPYDKQSVMHSRVSAWLRPVQGAMGQYEPLGRRDDQLSREDIVAINYLYCSGPHFCDTYQQQCEAAKELKQTRAACNSKLIENNVTNKM